MSRSDELRLGDILEAALLIEQLSWRGFEAFSEDPALKPAMERLLEIIGEAAGSLSEESGHSTTAPPCSPPGFFRGAPCRRGLTPSWTMSSPYMLRPPRRGTACFSRKLKEPTDDDFEEPLLLPGRSPRCVIGQNPLDAGLCGNYCRAMPLDVPRKRAPGLTATVTTVGGGEEARRRCPHPVPPIRRPERPLLDAAQVAR